MRNDTLIQNFGKFTSGTGIANISFSTNQGSFGSWTSLGTTIGRVNEIWIGFLGYAGSVVNIGVGASGSQEIVIPSAMTGGVFYPIKFPVSIPSGQTLWVQGCTPTGGSGRVLTGAVGIKYTQLNKLLTNIQTIGFGESTGTTGITPSATANTMGSWTSLGTLSNSIQWLRIFASPFSGPNSIPNYWAVNIGFGPSGSQVVLDTIMTSGISGATYLDPPTDYEICLPAGTELWAQSAMNSTNAFNVDVMGWIGNFT